MFFNLPTTRVLAVSLFASARDLFFGRKLVHFFDIIYEDADLGLMFGLHWAEGRICFFWGGRR